MWGWEVKEGELPGHSIMLYQGEAAPASQMKGGWGQGREAAAARVQLEVAWHIS